MFNLDIAVPRDGHYHEGWHLRDAAGNDISLVGHTITAAAQPAAGTNPVIGTATIDVYDAEHGRFTMTWAGSSFASVAGPTERVRLSWKLRQTYPDGIVKDIAGGHLIIIPENS